MCRGSQVCKFPTGKVWGIFGYINFPEMETVGLFDDEMSMLVCSCWVTTMIVMFLFKSSLKLGLVWSIRPTYVAIVDVSTDIIETKLFILLWLYFDRHTWNTFFLKLKVTEITDLDVLDKSSRLVQAFKRPLSRCALTKPSRCPKCRQNSNRALISDSKCRLGVLNPFNIQYRSTINDMKKF